MSGSGASAAVKARAIAALGALSGVAVYGGPPVQSAAPYAVVEAGPERGWGWKGGDGRELRLAATLWDRGENPARLLGLAAEAEAALAAMAAAGDGWRLASLVFVRAELLPPRKGAPGGLWARTIEFRVRVERV